MVMVFSAFGKNWQVERYPLRSKALDRWKNSASRAAGDLPGPFFQYKRAKPTGSLSAGAVRLDEAIDRKPTTRVCFAQILQPNTRSSDLRSKAAFLTFLSGEGSQ